MLDGFRDNSKGKRWTGKLSGLWVLYKSLLRRHGQFLLQETFSFLALPASGVVRLTHLTPHNMMANVCLSIPMRHLHVTGRDVGHRPQEGSWDAGPVG